MPTPQNPLQLGGAFLADPHGSYAALRRTGSVHRAVDPDGGPLFLVTRYQDVRAAAADRRLSVSKRYARAARGHVHSMPAELDAHLLNSEPATHARLRRLSAIASGRRIRSSRPGKRASNSSRRSRLTRRGPWSRYLGPLLRIRRPST